MGMDQKHGTPTTTTATTTTTPEGADAVGQRLSLRIDKVERSGMVIAYFPKTQKHRIRFDEGRREKNLRLKEWRVNWLHFNSGSPPEDDSHSVAALTLLELAIRRDAAGRRLEVYNQVRQKWFQGTVLKYVPHCQQHALTIEPEGKVHMVDLTQQVWRYTDLVGNQELPRTTALDTSKYRGVQRFTEHSWKATYEDLDVGCFATEKDAALAYDVYARKRGTSVNFDDRRICRRVMKALRIPEPEQAVETTEQSLVSDESSNHSEDAPSLADEEKPESEEINHPNSNHEKPSQNTSQNGSKPSRNECKETPSLVVVEKANEDSDATPNLETEETDLDDVAATNDPPAKDSHVTVAAAEPILREPPKVRRRISVDEEEEEEEQVNNRPRISAKKAASKACEELQEDSEFEFQDDEEEETDDEEFTSSSSSECDDEGPEAVIPQRKRGRPRKPTAHLLADSDEEEKIHTPVIQKKSRKRALMELQSYNSPPRNNSEKPKQRKRKRAVWPVGTRFVKEFPEFGTFEGRITEWDGKHYHVYYSEDEDQEELSEYEFDNYEILSVPGGDKGNLLDKQKKRRTKRKQKQASLV